MHVNHLRLYHQLIIITHYNQWSQATYINPNPRHVYTSCHWFLRPSPRRRESWHYVSWSSASTSDSGKEGLQKSRSHTCLRMVSFSQKFAKDTRVSETPLSATVGSPCAISLQESWPSNLSRLVTVIFSIVYQSWLCQFQLEDRHRVWVTQEGPPPLTEIYSERYAFQRPQRPGEAFFHYFHSSKTSTHATRRWIDHLPHKLDGSIYPANKQFGAMPTAWGVLIEERLDQHKVFCIVVLPLIVCTVGITVAWSIFSGSRTEGLTAGALIATILAVGFVSVYKTFD